MAFPVNNESIPSNTSFNTANTPLKRTDAEKNDFPENHESVSTEKKTAAAYSSITPNLSSIPQIPPHISGHSGALFQGTGSSPFYLQDKISRFFLECFSYGENQIEAHQGLWTSRELQKKYLEILTHYTMSISVSKTARLFFSHAIKGYLEFISLQCQGYEWIETQFVTDFPSAFEHAALSEAVRKKYIVVFNALGTEYLQMQSVRKEYEYVLIELEQVKKEREDSFRRILRFPSVLGSGQLFLDKCFYQDALMIEQFYHDYHQMLSYNELYLARFMQAIQQACAILES